MPRKKSSSTRQSVPLSRILTSNPWAVLMFCAINTLFVAKYTSRFTGWWPLVAIAFFVLLLIASTFAVSIRHSFHKKKKQVYVAFAVVAVAFLALQYSINPMTVQVDRWSAIDSFLSFLLSGRYPYAAPTHLGGYGSPLPVWQILHLPFFLWGNVGLSLLVCLGLFISAIRYYWGSSKAMVCLLLMVLSPAFWFEVAVRSDLLANFLLVAAWCCWLRERKHYSKRWFAISLVTGLFLSTRLSTIIPIGMVLLRPYMTLTWPKKTGSVAVALLTAALTVLPFLLWGGSQFFSELGPFALQTRQGHPADFAIFLPLGIWLTYQWKSTAQMGRNIAAMLCALVIVTFAHNMLASGNYQLFSATYDISYFCMALPFVILSLSMTETKH